MLDFNRQYYEENCSSGYTRVSWFESKPGKDDLGGKSFHIPQTFRIDESDCDEKRTRPCSPKITQTSPNH